VYPDRKEGKRKLVVKNAKHRAKAAIRLARKRFPSKAKGSLQRIRDKGPNSYAGKTIEARLEEQRTMGKTSRGTYRLTKGHKGELAQVPWDANDTHADKNQRPYMSAIGREDDDTRVRGDPVERNAAHRVDEKNAREVWNCA